MKKSLLDHARESNSEASAAVYESIGNEVFVFRAQMLLDENEQLMLDGKYDTVITNTDRISVIIAREQSLNLLDEIRCLLSMIKSFIDDAMENQVGTSQLRTELVNVEEHVKDGTLYKTKSDLAKILEEIADLRRNLMPGWARKVIIEMNGKMDLLLHMYREFPKQFFEFEENPVHILTSYLEDVIVAMEGADLSALDKSVIRFYLFYYQTERFMTEEKAFREEGVIPTITRIILPSTGTSPDDAGTGEEAISKNDIVPTPATGEMRSEDVEQRKFVVSDIKIDESELKGIYDDLKAISEAEAKKEESAAAEEAPQVSAQPQVQAPPTKAPPAKKTPPKMKPPKPAAPTRTTRGPRPGESKDPPRKAPPSSKDKHPKKGKPPGKAGKEKAKQKEKPPGKEGKEKAKQKEKPSRIPRIRTLIKDVFKKKEGKMLPSYTSAKEPKKGVSRYTNAKEAIGEELRILSDKYSDELKEILDADIDGNMKLMKLDAIAFSNMLKKDLEKAIIFYDAILRIDSNYKNAYEKRDECYELVLEKLLNTGG